MKKYYLYISYENNKTHTFGRVIVGFNEINYLTRKPIREYIDKAKEIISEKKNINVEDIDMTSYQFLGSDIDFINSP